MRVPRSGDDPTYGDTFKVGFWRWLTSSKTDRKEWARRRNAATMTGKVGRKLDQAHARAEERYRQAKAAQEQDRGGEE